MTNSKNVLLAALNELLIQWTAEHDRLLNNAKEVKMNISSEELDQLQAVLLNLDRLQGLILWIQQNEKIRGEK